MSSVRWSLCLLFLCSTTGVQAQTRKTVWQIHAIGTTADLEFLGAGVGIGRRSGGRLTYHLLVTPGLVDNSLAVRPEGVLTFSLDPGRREGISPYGGGGLVAVITGSSTQAFMVLLLGLESAPQRGSGWFVELGVGGGVRGSAGVRLRR